MGHEGLVEAFGEQLGTASVGHIPVRRMMSEEVPLGLQGIRERLVALDVLL